MIQTHKGYMPPMALELEQAVLGCCLVSPPVLETAFEVIPDADVFYSESHKSIYTAMLELYQKGTTVDFLNIAVELKKMGKLEAVGGDYYIGELMGNAVGFAHIDEYCRVIIEKYIRREVIRFSQQMQAQSYSDENDTFDLMDEVAAFSMQLSDKMIRKPYISVRSSVVEVMQETAHLMTKEVSMVGVPTGYRELNRITGGWKQTDLIILAARPSVGKTAFLLNLALNAARDAERPTAVGIFSLEMNHKQLTQRIVANVSNLELEKIKNGNLTNDEFNHLAECSGAVANLPIYIDDTATMTTIELKAKARRMKRVHNVGLIIIDYLQLMSSDSKSRGNREQEISKISRELKLLAKTLEIPIIALSQLNRAVEGRADSEPKLADLRDSGAIEQDADMVMFLFGHPKDFLKKNPYKYNERMLTIAKHRDGKLAAFTFDFDGSKQRFEKEDIQMMDAHFTEVPNDFARPIKAEISHAPSLLPLHQPHQGVGNDELPF